MIISAVICYDCHARNTLLFQFIYVLVVDSIKSSIAYALQLYTVSENLLAFAFMYLRIANIFYMEKVESIENS